MPIQHLLITYGKSDTYLRVSLLIYLISSYSYNSSVSYGFIFLTDNAFETVDNSICKLSLFTSLKNNFSLSGPISVDAFNTEV